MYPFEQLEAQAPEQTFGRNALKDEKRHRDAAVDNKN